jgi:superfamily II DNA or RNA helicase
VDRQLRLESAAVVKATIARLILAERPSPARVGSISLQPHQISAVARLQSALDQFNGALLCDDVGMGKTYVATAVARQYSRCLVVAPAALASMWSDALAKTGVVAEMLTLEALSRADVNALLRRRDTTVETKPYDLVVVDEAHHVRNPATNRYFALASLARGAQVLLLSATPIHNRRTDLVALLSLFLGSRARTMTSGELARCVVRREHSQLEGAFAIPKVEPVTHHQLPDSPRLVDELMSLPPPVPVREGGLAGVLIGRGLVHQWASSEAALHEAMRRRIARATALCSSLEAGTYPSARELETWIYSEGALQLGFPELLAAPVGNRAELLDAIRWHLEALREFRRRSAFSTTLDTERARIMREIREAYAGAKIVAFAQYSETVSTLFRRLVTGERVAMLTSHGARVAGGVLTRREAICRFAPRASQVPPPRPAEAVDLLLTTDLLSEGVNLQDAEVVVHLDVPWTLARLEQRVGRVARMGSLQPRVHVHLIRPPQSAAAVLDSEMIVQRKWIVARAEIGTSAPNPSSGRDPDIESTPARTERLRSILHSWVTTDDVDRDEMIVATVNAPHSGFIAVISMNARPLLLVCAADEISTDLSAQIQVCLSVGSDEIPTTPPDSERAVRAIHNWCAQESASTAAGVGPTSCVRRKQITNRIDSAIQDAPPHLRSVRSGIAARARRVATTQQCAAVELELDSLLHSDLPDDQWLRAIAKLDTVPSHAHEPTVSPDALRIRALLLMRRMI